jgi:glycosyltransferase involved in cell wall biosynthesis
VAQPVAILSNKKREKRERIVALALKHEQTKIIAVIPAYNEESHIVPIIKETKKYVDQVFVIDDGSTDKTGELAKVAGAIVIKHDFNMGKGVAINHAFETARELQVKVMVLLDGDGQHNPEEIPSLLKPVLTGKADMVVGSRFLRNNRIPKYRMLGQTILTVATNIGTGIKVSDTQSGFRSFSQKSISRMSFQESGFAVESEMQFKARKYNLKVVEVPIITNYDEKVKRSPMIHGFGVLFRVINLIMTNTSQANS